MALGEHFREFRRRLFVSAVAILIGAVVAGFYYERVFAVIQAPFQAYKDANPDLLIDLNFAEATAALSNLLSLSIFVGVVAASPVWLYQAWAFIAPGLTRKEKKISLAFVASTIPLFLAGCALAYWILPKSLFILYGISPAETSNLQEASKYISFVTRFILVFGLGFLFPVVLVGLNAMGVLPGKRLLAGWRMAVVLIFVFAAIATPTADPFTMFVFAIPLSLLYFGACGVALLIDRRRAKARPDWLNVSDTEASPL